MKPFNPTVEQQAVLDLDSNIVITACPGSGKTAVIAAKVRQILPSLPSYRGIAAISYTRKASAELRRRCNYNGVDTKRSFFGTIDSFSISEIVMPFFGHLCGRTPSSVEVKYYSLLSASEQGDFSDVNISALTTTQTASLIQRLQALYLAGTVVMETVGIIAAYVVEHSLACQRYLKSRYAAIFVDEYQDSGEPQHILFTQLSKLGITCVAVGDVNQSIFSFAQRKPVYLQSLCVPASGFRHLELTINHRCKPSIVNYANRLLDPGCELQESDGIRVFRYSITGTQVEVVEWITSVLETVKKNFGVEHNREIGILVRNSGTGKIVRKHLGFPSRFFNDNKLSESTSAFSAILASLLTFRMDFKLTAQSLIEEFVHARVRQDVLLGLRKLILGCRTCTEAEFIERAVVVVEFLTGKNVPQTSIDELREVLGSPEELNFFKPVSDDEVQILTLHKAKGLEFKVVFHLDLYDWILPRRRFVENNYDPVFENEQECLNLHYVGVTRAEDVCILVTSTQRVNFNDELKNARPSQFLQRAGLEGLYS